MSIRSPFDFFGEQPGSDRTLILWDKIVSYFYHLEENSGKIKVFEAGKTTQGNPFIYAIITSESNMSRLDEYKEISKKLADPKGLSDDETDALAKRGKAVFVQTHGIHSSEPAGTQLSPVLAYELIVSDDKKIAEILDNVIFIMVPCVNPDGEIMVTNWYNRSKNTPWEGLRFPGMYHIYARHCNNRDFVHENLVETKYVNDILLRDWMPQVLIDHHQQIWDENRISVPPCVNPNWPEISPIGVREEQSYGYQIACEMEEDGYVGVVAGDSWYNTFPIYSLANTCTHSNVLGMLVETADARLASPAVVPREKLWRYTEKSTECPNPWKGGVWKFSDAVRYTKKVSYTMLSLLSRDREAVLRRRAKKAKEQTARGAASEVKGYFIPRNQHDPGVLAKLISILDAQRVEYYELGSEHNDVEKKFPAGTYFVPCAQARYSLVSLIFANHPYPVCRETVWEDGTVHVFDSSSTTVTLPMGIETFECLRDPESLAFPAAPIVSGENEMPAYENESFKKANLILESGGRVYRGKDGGFNTAANGKEIRLAKCAILSPGKNSSGFMGYARLVLEKFHFDIKVITDKELREGGLEGYDALILAGHTKSELEAGDTLADGMPEEYRSGLGSDGKEILKAFVSRGGRIIAWDKSCIYAADLFALPVADTTGGIGGNGGLYDANGNYLSQGAVLNIKCAPHELTRGMPDDVRIKHNSGPAYEPTSDDVEIIARHKIDDFFSGGLIIGEDLLKGHACALRARVGEGDIVLYTFDPFYRAQSDGTFKLVFNALYK